jgi:hypothetical protein
VKAKMEDRRDRRKSRRARRWYRPARFLHRAASTRGGRLPPSIKTNVWVSGLPTCERGTRCSPSARLSDLRTRRDHLVGKAGIKRHICP